MSSVSSYKYAMALAGLGSEKGVLPDLGSVFSDFLKSCSSEQALGGLLGEKKFDRERKKDLLSKYLKAEYPDRLQALDIFRGFLSVVIDNGKEACLPEIFRLFSDKSDELQGVVKLQAVTASALSAGQLDRIKNAFMEKTGRNVTVSNAVDASLIGGVVYRIRDKMIDFSIAGGLKRLEKEISNC